MIGRLQSCNQYKERAERRNNQNKEPAPVGFRDCRGSQPLKRKDAHSIRTLVFNGSGRHVGVKVIGRPIVLECKIAIFGIDERLVGARYAREVDFTGDAKPGDGCSYPIMTMKEASFLQLLEGFSGDDAIDRPGLGDEDRASELLS